MAAADAVRLRPVAEEDLAFLERFDRDPSVSEPFEWHGFRDARKRRERWEQDGYLGGDQSLLLVATPEDVVGFVGWRWMNSYRGCANLGILLLPEHRGRGIGTAAQRLVAEYLFAHTTVHRLEAVTETINVAEQRALERAGFQREGVLRGLGFGRGEWRDGIIYSRLRTDHCDAP